jgi:hypothetical protein
MASISPVVSPVISGWNGFILIVISPASSGWNGFNFSCRFARDFRVEWLQLHRHFPCCFLVVPLRSALSQCLVSLIKSLNFAGLLEYFAVTSSRFQALLATTSCWQPQHCCKDFTAIAVRWIILWQNESNRKRTAYRARADRERADRARGYRARGAASAAAATSLRLVT